MITASSALRVLGPGLLGLSGTAFAQTAAEIAPAPPPKGIQWTSGEYTWKVGGYVKVDLIHDFDAIGSADTFDPRTIPTSGADEPGDATRIHAKQSRLNA